MRLERSSADALPPITPPVGVLVIVEQISHGESEHIEGFFTVIIASVSFKSRRAASRWEENSSVSSTVGCIIAKVFNSFSRFNRFAPFKSFRMFKLCDRRARGT